MKSGIFLTTRSEFSRQTSHPVWFMNRTRNQEKHDETHERWIGGWSDGHQVESRRCLTNFRGMCPTR